jgi:hypothetical protein
VTSLICYRISPHAPRLVPARAERDWMDATDQRFAYRCLPLTIANSMGWEMLCPMTFEAEWNGERGLDAIEISADSAEIETFVASHFGGGVLTFMTHYLFRTDEGIGLNVRGSPNRPKDGIGPLEGIVETDWLDFPFTMNWKFTRPGKVRFEEGEPFCFIAPMAYRALADVRPTIVPIEAVPERLEAFRRYSALRGEFNQKLQDPNSEASRQRWQRWYFKGVQPDGTPGNPRHLSKFRAAEPVFDGSGGADSETDVLPRKASPPLAGDGQ